MPQYEYVVERFKTYHSWESRRVGSQESIFEARWSANRWFNRLSFVLMLVALIASTLFAIRVLPSDKAVELSLGDLGSLVQRYRENEYSFTVSPCPKGIIGELENGDIYWVELGYNGRRWTYAYDIPPSALADTCIPPLALQYQRMALVIVSGILLSALYAVGNYHMAKRRWSQIHPIILRKQDNTVLIRQNDIEYIPLTHEELDEQYNSPTDFIPLQAVYKAALILIILGLICGWIAANA
jgi:hypothetical protein